MYVNGTRIKAGLATCLNSGDIICFGSKVPKNELRYTFYCEVEGSGMARLQKITASAVHKSPLQNLVIVPQTTRTSADDEGEATPPLVKEPRSNVRLNPSARKRLKLDDQDLTPPAVHESRSSSLTPPVEHSHHPVGCGSTASTTEAKGILPFHAGPSLASSNALPLSIASPKSLQAAFHVGPSLSSPDMVCSVSTPSRKVRVSSRIVCSTPGSSVNAVRSVTSPVRGAGSSSFPGSPPKGQTASFHPAPSAIASPLRNSGARLVKVESCTSAPFHAGPSAIASPLRRNSVASVESGAPPKPVHSAIASPLRTEATIIVGSGTSPTAIPFHAGPSALSSPLRTNCCVTATTSHITPVTTGPSALTSMSEENCAAGLPKAISFHVGPSALGSPSCSITAQISSAAVSTSHSSETSQRSHEPAPLTNVTASLSPPSSSDAPLDVTLVPSEPPLPRLANDDSVIIVSPPPVLPQATAGSSHVEASNLPATSGNAVLVQSSPLLVPVSATVKPSPALSAASKSTEVELDDLFDELSNSNGAMLDEAMFGATSSPNALPGPTHLDGATIQVMAVQDQMEQERLKLMSNIEALKSELAAKNELISKREQDHRETGVVSSMKEEFMCVICQELFIDAHTLPCAHSFCKYCITEWMKRSKNVCPICRKNIYSSKPVHSLVLDNAISKMELNMNAQEKQDRMAVRNERKGPVSHGVTAKTPAITTPAVVSIPTSSGASSTSSSSGSSSSARLTSSTEVITLDDSDEDSDTSSSDEELYSISDSDEEVCVFGYSRSYGRCFHCGK